MIGSLYIVAISLYKYFITRIGFILSLSTYTGYYTLIGINVGEEVKEQSYANHTRYQPLQHFIWLPLSFILLVYAIIQFVRNGFSFQLLLLVGAVLLAIISGMLARIYATTLQDRLIRTEEQLRYYMLTEKHLDNRLANKQLIALRFVSDEELVELVNRTVNENLSPDEIKRNVKTWSADYHHV